MGKLRVDQNQLHSDGSLLKLERKKYGEDAIASKLEVARQTIFRWTDQTGSHPSASSFGLRGRAACPGLSW